MKRISTVGPKGAVRWGGVGIGYVRPDLFLDQLTVIKTDLNFVSVKNITFKSSYNWFCMA